MPRFDRRKVNEELERRSGLTHSLSRTVVDRSDIILAADHRADGPVAVERNQRALCFAGRVRADCFVSGTLHIEVKRRPDVDRLPALVDQRIELRQRPVGEIAHAVLFGFGREHDIGGVGRSNLRRRQQPLFLHHVENDTGTADGSFCIGAW